MKLLKYLALASVVFASSVFADAGISVSYRSSPVIIQNNYTGTAYTDPTYVIRSTTQRSLNMVTINLYFDDTLKGHDKKEDKGSRWPRALRPSKGAGYIFGFNFNYAAEDLLIEYYSADFYIGKRLFILPHFAHMYFKVGPSYAKYNHWTPETWTHSNETRIGGFYNIGIQVQALKGIKLFAEAEFRGYSPAPTSSNNNWERNYLDFANALPPFSKNYKDTKFDKQWFRDLITQGIRFGMKFTF